MLRARRISRDERQVDLGLHRRRQLDLGLLRSLFQALERIGLLAQVDAVFLLKLIGEVVHDPGVKVFTTEEGIAVGRLHLNHAVTDFEHGHVEGTATKVVDHDRAFALLLQPIGHGSRGRLVDDPLDLKASDLTSILGRLPLGIVEVGGDRDHGLGHLLAEVGLSGFLHLAEDEGRNLAGRELLAVNLNPGVAVVGLDHLEGCHLVVLAGLRVFEPATNQALDGVEGAGWVGHRLALCRLADQPLAAVAHGHHRWGGAGALGVFDHAGVRPFHDSDTGVGRAQVNSDDFAHIYLSFLQRTLELVFHEAPATGPLQARCTALSQAGPQRHYVKASGFHRPQGSQLI